MRVTSIICVLVIVNIASAQMEPIRIDKDGRGFELAESGTPFVPWGHNYVGPDNKLLEDVWETDWETIVEDFREMKDMGANVVRIHLQVNHFMEAPDRTNQASLDRLAKLLHLAEETGLYVNITGLACYRTADAPAWYDKLSDGQRWNTQARFWEAVAEVGARSSAVFCYDLMNEPVSPGGKREAGQWYSGKPFGGYDFVQFIALDASDRPRHEIARHWIEVLRRAIRTKDKDTLITVGLLPWTEKWGHLSGFVPDKVAPELDFIAVHIYPETGKVDEALTVLKHFKVGKPIVIEETFNLRCSRDELRGFLLRSRGIANGWIGHYAGQTIEDFHELEKMGRLTMPQAFMRDWLMLFEAMRAEMTSAPAPVEDSR